MQVKTTLQHYRKAKKVYENLCELLERPPSEEEFLLEFEGSRSRLDRGNTKDIFRLVSSQEVELAAEDETDSFRILHKQSIHNYEMVERRMKLGLSQEQLAAKSGLHLQAVCAIEKFDRYVTDEEKNAIAKTLKCNVDTIFPAWTQFIVDKRKEMRNVQIFEIGREALDCPEVLQIEAPSTIQLDGDLLKRVLRPLLEKLRPRERAVLDFRYGMTEGVSHTLDEVADEFGVTRERIRQIEAKAIQGLKDLAEQEELDLRSLIQ